MYVLWFRSIVGENTVFWSVMIWSGKSGPGLCRRNKEMENSPLHSQQIRVCTLVCVTSMWYVSLCTEYVHLFVSPLRDMCHNVQSMYTCLCRLYVICVIMYRVCTLVCVASTWYVSLCTEYVHLFNVEHYILLDQVVWRFVVYTNYASCVVCNIVWNNHWIGRPR